MPEPLLVKCRKCGLVFDKHLNRTCPKCEPRVRPGTQSFTDTKASSGPHGAGASGAADADTAAAPKRALRIPMPEPRITVALVFGIALGAAGARVLWKPVAESTSVDSVTSSTAGDAQPSAAPSRPAGPLPPPVASSIVTASSGAPPARPIELVDAHPGAPREDGSRDYTVVLVNRTGNTMKELHVHGLGDDTQGRRFVTDDVTVNPALLGTAREATASIRVPKGVTLNEFAVSAWVQHGETLRAAEREEPPPISARTVRPKQIPVPDRVGDAAGATPSPAQAEERSRTDESGAVEPSTDEPSGPEPSDAEPSEPAPSTEPSNPGE